MQSVPNRTFEKTTQSNKQLSQGVVNSFNSSYTPETACEVAVKDGFAKTDDTLVIAAGMPFGQPVNTNLIRVANIWSSTFAKHN